MSVKNKPNEIYITRTYDAPVKLVWDAWTDPKQAAKWWGPRGFTITTHSKDFRVGGTWHYTMHGPDGVDYPNKTVYHEIKKHARLVYDHGGYDDRPPLFKVTVDFIDQGEKTLMEMTTIFESEAVAKEMGKFIKQAGGNATWDRLAEYLAEDEKFVINRSFDAPVGFLFQMWTDPKHVVKWLPPGDFKMTYLRADIKTGGSAFYLMENPAGMKMYGVSTYQEVTAPRRLVFSQIFCDENERLSRHPMAAEWPAMMLTTVEFTEEENNKSRVTLTTIVYGEATEAERELFKASRGGMTQGWSGSFDALDEALKN
jgi:uncharacterized protein YndB with AHSA1/START domain